MTRSTLPILIALATIATLSLAGCASAPNTKDSSGAPQPAKAPSGPHAEAASERGKSESTVPEAAPDSTQPQSEVEEERSNDERDSGLSRTPTDEAPRPEKPQKEAPAKPPEPRAPERQAEKPPTATKDPSAESQTGDSTGRGEGTSDSPPTGGRGAADGGEPDPEAEKRAEVAKVRLREALSPFGGTLVDHDGRRYAQPEACSSLCSATLAICESRDVICEISTEAGARQSMAADCSWAQEECLAAQQICERCEASQ